MAINNPDNIMYTKTHEWLKDLGGGRYAIGITDYAQNELGNLVYAGLPTVGDVVAAGSTFADVESVKAVSDVLSPVDGTVVEINEQLLDAPEMINDSPYEAWFAIVESDGSGELMTAEEYEEYLKTL